MYIYINITFPVSSVRECFSTSLTLSSLWLCRGIHLSPYNDEKYAP